MPPKNAPYQNAYNPSWGNHLNISWGPKPPQYAPPTHSQYASSSQPQPQQSTSPVEQAILDLSKLVGDFVEKQKTINGQLSQKIDTMENNVDKRIDGLQREIDHKLDNLHKSISRLANQQHVYPEEECLIDTMVEEHHQQQLQEGLIENFSEYSEGLSKSLDIGVVVCPLEKVEEILPLLSEEGSRKEEGEEPQKTTAQATNSPLPHLDPVHILPTPTAHSTPETPTIKATPSALPVQNCRKLVAIDQTFATTSKTLETAHVAWHSGWLIRKPSWLKFRAPEPQ